MGVHRSAPVVPLRIPPQAMEAEQSVLGGLMLDNSAWERIADKVSASDFYTVAHRLIFRCCQELVESSHPCDVVTVSERAERQGRLEEMGGFPYLGQLARDTPSAANIVFYAELVRERAILRQLIAAGAAIAELGYQPGERPVAELLNEAERIIFAIADQYQRQPGLQPITPALVTTIETLQALTESDSPYTGLTSPWIDLDRLTGGLHPGELVIVAARPSMGKTAIALNLARWAAIRREQPVAFFSLEMSAEQLSQRLLAAQGRLDQTKFRHGNLSEKEWADLTRALSALASAPIWIDDSGSSTPFAVAARARRLQRELGRPLGLVIVDYLQLLSSPGAESRQVEISTISRQLKVLAKELRVPVIALSQLNRKLEDRTNKRPGLADLRESGAIEADADLILFLYRDEIYDPHTLEKGVAELIIGKQRNGPTGTVKLTFLGAPGRFESISHEHE